MAELDRQYFVRKVAWPWLAVALVAVAVVAVWGVITQPSPHRWIGPAVLVLIMVPLVRSLLREPSYLEGTELVQVGPLRTHRADAARATRVLLRPNRGGSAQLLVRDEAGRSAFVPLLTITQYVTVAQPPELLDRIGEVLAAAPAEETAGVRKVLAIQADHLRAGGRPEDSPLRPLTSTALLGSAEAAGLMSILGHLE